MISIIIIIIIVIIIRVGVAQLCETDGHVPETNPYEVAATRHGMCHALLRALFSHRLTSSFGVRRSSGVQLHLL